MPPPEEGVAVIVATAPEQIVPSLFVVPDVSETDNATVGGDDTVTVADDGEPAQPLLEYVTEYVPAEDIDAVAPLPKLLDQAKVPPLGVPVAVKVPVCPLQIVNVDGVIDTVGNALTVTNTFC